MDWLGMLPPQLLTGGVVISILVISWWMLVRGVMHTDTEFQFVLQRLTKVEEASAEKDATIRELTDQNGELIEANKTITHVLQGFTAAVEAKR